MVKKKTHNLKKKSKSKSSKSAKWQIFCLKMGKNQQKTAPYKYKSNKKQDNWPQKKQPNDLFK